MIGLGMIRGLLWVENVPNHLKIVVWYDRESGLEIWDGG